VLHQNIQQIGAIMKAKLLQISDFLKAVALWTFKVLLRGIKVVVEETILVLQKLDTVLTRNV
jgi:hypothetical protein